MFIVCFEVVWRWFSCDILGDLLVVCGLVFHFVACFLWLCTWMLCNTVSC